MKRVLLAFGGTLVGGFALFAVVNHFQRVENPGRLGVVIGSLAVVLAVAAALDEVGHRAVNKGRSRPDAGGLLPDGDAGSHEGQGNGPRVQDCFTLGFRNSACQEPSREITIKSKDLVRRERSFSRIFLAFPVLFLCVVWVTWNAPQIVHTIEGLVFTGGFAGLIGVTVVLGIRWNKFVQRYRLVFTNHWTEPKEVTLALTRLWYKEKGLAASLRPSVYLGLIVSCLMALNWLLARENSKSDPGKYALPLPWALALILLSGLGFAALPHLVNFLSALFNSRTIGFDNEWIGWLQGEPGRVLWRYEQIATVRFGSLRVGEREFRLMIVSPREGREATFGLSDEVDLRQITDLLVAKGVEVSEL